MLEALDGRLNSPPRLRVCSWCFLGQPQCFQRFRFFATSAATRFFDYELWYATGTRVLAGDEIFFFRAAKYEFMYPPPCALFLAGASLLGQGGLILFLVMINSAAWFCSAKLSANLAVGQRVVTTVWLYLGPSLLGITRGRINPLSV
jgi:hypothetical protein